MGSSSVSKQSRNLTALEEWEKVRKKPEVIFGTRDLSGATHGVDEIIANAEDEASEGRGKIIKISIEPNNVFTVEDFGAGLPMHEIEGTGKFNWELALCQTYASGKYDAKQYKRALGTNGVGLASMQLASEFMHVESVYDGEKYIMDFEHGRPVSELKIEKASSEKLHGTLIKFKPDSQVFYGIKDTEIPVEHFVDTARKGAMNIPGLKYVITHYSAFPNGNEICYEGGIKQFIEECFNSRIGDVANFSGSVVGHDDIDGEASEDYTLDMSLTFSFSTEYSFIENYHNGSLLSSAEKNMTLDVIKNSMASCFTEFARSKKKITRADRIIFKDIEPNIILVGCTNSPGYLTWFEHQTKNGVINPFIKKSYSEFCVNSITGWLKNDRNVDKILDIALLNKKAREEADKVSRDVIAKVKKSANSIGNRVDFFADCTGKNPEDCEIYFVEGVSAYNTTKSSRNYRTQAILALTGKPLNCQKKQILAIIKDNVILRIARAIGCGFELPAEALKQFDQLRQLPQFDLNKLKYHRIIICTDGDVDGKHIRCLCLCIMYKLFPTLLKLGMVYIVESPLYEVINEETDESVFAYSNDELNQIKEEYTQNGTKFYIQRSKGLGENTVEMMDRTTMNPATRRIVQVEYSDEEAELAAEAFEKLLGNDIASRKSIIEANFASVEAEI